MASRPSTAGGGGAAAVVTVARVVMAAPCQRPHFWDWSSSLAPGSPWLKGVPGRAKRQPAGGMVHAGQQPAAAILSCAACIAVLTSVVVTFLPVAASASRPLTALPTLVSNSDSAGISGSGTALVARTAANAAASAGLAVKLTTPPLTTGSAVNGLSRIACSAGLVMNLTNCSAAAWFLVFLKIERLIPATKLPTSLPAAGS